MKVFNDGFVNKLARLNVVLRRLRAAGIAVEATDYNSERLRLPTAPPTAIVPRAIHKVRGLNVAKLDGVTLVWEGRP